MGTTKTLPSYETLKAYYPGKGWSQGQVASTIGGMVKHNFEDPKQTSYKLTCALRVSRALNYSGHSIRTAGSERANSGSDKLWYIYGVPDMEKYLNRVYGSPSIKKEGSSKGDVKPEEFAKARGIILFKNYHVDLWNGKSCEYACYFSEVTAVMLWSAP